MTGLPSIHETLTMYAAGYFPMDDPDRQDEPLPFYAADPRAIFELDEEGLERVRRRVRRSLPRGRDWVLALDRAPEAVIAGCARPREQDGVWLTPRLCELYRQLHAVGAMHSFEIWVDGELAAGMVGVLLGRVASLETMFHTVPHAGNVLVERTLTWCAAHGFAFADVQMATPHTRRLGVREVSAPEYDRRLQETRAA